MLVAGVIAIIAGLALRLDPFVVLGGIMLVVSGGVKMVMLRLWRGLTPGGTQATATTAPRK